MLKSNDNEKTSVAPPALVIDSDTKHEFPGIHLMISVIGKNSGILSGVTSSCNDKLVVTCWCDLEVAVKVTG